MMVGKRLVGVAAGCWVFAILGLITGGPTQATPLAACPGHPDAIGTSRTLVVDPRAHPRIGSMQYPETLPLHDHEVVLTFDDGPLPRNSNRILQILADQCVKANFFLVGKQSRAYPASVRELVALGHTIGTHSQSHPLNFETLPPDAIKQEVEDGIASAAAALPDPTMVAPFFRVPGLLRSRAVEDWLASKGIQIWSADFDADDWRRISPEQVYERAMKRIEAKGKGILLLHDIQARTVAALPMILHGLKVRGYHIVHVVPATPQRPATPTDPMEWRLHPPSAMLPVAERPKLPIFAFGEVANPVTPSRGLDRPEGSTHWPQVTTLALRSAAVTLPVPAKELFETPEQAPPAPQTVAPKRKVRTTRSAAHRLSAAAAIRRRRHGHLVLRAKHATVRGEPH
jgi:peptidoglycan/xylan/chitin deacetylase (PgdA/CDA1 family)